VIQGKFFPVNLELTIRGIYKPPVPARGIWFNWKYVEDALPYAKDDMYILLAESPQDVPRIEAAVDAMFRNSPSPTRTETEKQLELDFISMLGNLKAFILSICLAVVFAIILVSANTMAMSIRERTREVAVMRTVGFTRRSLLTMLVAEAVTLSLTGGLLGSGAAYGFIYGVSRLVPAASLIGILKIGAPTLLLVLAVAALVGFLSGIVPAQGASRITIAAGLRHLG
jgi:putative ABC transport system permease protein